MFQHVLRETRRNGWKSRRKWQKAQRRKQREEQRLAKAKDYAEPDRWINVDGLMIGVHVLRERFRGTVEYRFEFRRKDGSNGRLAMDFGEADLVVLQKAVQVARRYRGFQERKRKATRRLQYGPGGTTPSKAASTPRVNRGNRD